MIIVENCTEVATGKIEVWSPFTEVENCVVVLATTLLETWEIVESLTEYGDATDSVVEVFSAVSGETSVPLADEPIAVLVDRAPLASVVVYTLALYVEVAALPVPEAAAVVLLPPGAG